MGQRCNWRSNWHQETLRGRESEKVYLEQSEPKFFFVAPVNLRSLLEIANAFLQVVLGVDVAGIALAGRVENVKVCIAQIIQRSGVSWVI